MIGHPPVLTHTELACSQHQSQSCGVHTLSLFVPGNSLTATFLCLHLLAVRVINCDGSAQSSAVIAGLDWLAQNYKLPAVASMSLGSDSPNQALDDAVTAIINLGITAVIAAGNYNQGLLHTLGCWAPACFLTHLA